MIEFDHVSVTFQNRGKKFHAVSDVTLTVETGEFFGIVGPSGAGKSTLVRTVNRLQRTDSGSIRIDGREITGLKGRALREERLKIGMIFQHLRFWLPGYPAGRQRKGQRNCWPWWECPKSSMPTRRSFRVGRSREWPLPERWPTGRRFCSVMRQPAPWTRKIRLR